MVRGHRIERYRPKTCWCRMCWPGRKRGFRRWFKVHRNRMIRRSLKREMADA